jgi:hypothetical protein
MRVVYCKAEEPGAPGETDLQVYRNCTVRRAAISEEDRRYFSVTALLDEAYFRVVDIGQLIWKSHPHASAFPATPLVRSSTAKCGCRGQGAATSDCRTA